MQKCIFIGGMKSYLEQLDEAAASAGVELAAVCAEANIASTTLSRWRRGVTAPREDTARAIFEQIRKMSEDAT